MFQKYMVRNECYIVTDFFFFFFFTEESMIFQVSQSVAAQD